MSIGSETVDVASEGLIQSVARVQLARPSFAIPIVHFAERSNATYIQQADPRDRVSGFEFFHLGVTKTDSLLGKPHSVALGGPLVHAVIDPIGAPHAGTRVQLSPIVSQWLTDVQPPLTRLAFADFCGNLMEARRAAADVFKKRVSESGKDSALRWFSEAVIFKRLCRSALALTATRQQELNLERLLAECEVSVAGSRIDVTLPRAVVKSFERNVAAVEELAILRRLSSDATGSEIFLHAWRAEVSTSQSGLTGRRAAASRQTVERFGDRITWITQNLNQNPNLPDAIDTKADVYRAICVLRQRKDPATGVIRPNVVTLRQWNRYCDGAIPVPHAYLAAIIRLFPDVTWPMLTVPTYSDFLEATDAVRAIHARWTAASTLMRKRRPELATIAMRYYRDVPKVEGRLPLLARPEWIAAKPIHLDEATPARFEQGVPPREAERLEGLQIDFVELKARLSPRRPTNGECYRLTTVDLSRGEADLGFEATHFFSYVNELEAIGVELADWVIRQGGIEACLADENIIPGPGELKLRNAPERAFDIADRHSLAGVNCLLLARNLRIHEGDNATDFFFYHDRTDQTLEAQYTTHVVPAGGHQPYTRGFGRPQEANIYRTAVREFCEELYDKEEAAAVRAHGGDFLEHPEVALQVDAFFRSGAANVTLLGVGLDPLTLKPEILVAIVIDWDIAREKAEKRDLAFTRNYEAEVRPRPLSRLELQNILTNPPLGQTPDGGPPQPKPWLPAGAACVQLVIQSYGELMGGGA